jgi:phage FluMu protein Com
MVDVQDVRRISLTAAILAGVTLLWLFFLWLQDAGLWEWFAPRAALGRMPFLGWMWTGAGLFVLLIVVVVLPIFTVPTIAKADHKGRVRQVQCQNCKAVFVLEDTGARPLSHQCPSCKFIGVYTGKAPAVGDAPEPEKPKRIVRLDLTCGNCQHKFPVTDTGTRPLKVTCPDCGAVGNID